mgnify:FL=1
MFKRTSDILIAAAGLALLSPVYLLIAVALKLDSDGPVFFRQNRLGLGGAHFRIFKFRSMVADADKRGGTLTIGGDARVTRVGGFLRRHKLDELPQLINVLRGEMSLVGPRPEVPEYADLFPTEFRRILAVRPGITHRATLLFRNEEELLAATDDPNAAYIHKVMPAKMRLYIDALGEQSVMQDVRTIVETIFRVGETITAADLTLDTPEIGNIVSAARGGPRAVPAVENASAVEAVRYRRARETVA